MDTLKAKEPELELDSNAAFGGMSFKQGPAGASPAHGQGRVVEKEVLVSAAAPSSGGGLRISQTLIDAALEIVAGTAGGELLSRNKHVNVGIAEEVLLRLSIQTYKGAVQRLSLGIDGMISYVVNEKGEFQVYDETKRKIASEIDGTESFPLSRLVGKFFDAKVKGRLEFRTGYLR